MLVQRSSAITVFRLNVLGYGTCMLIAPSVSATAAPAAGMTLLAFAFGWAIGTTMALMTPVSVQLTGIENLKFTSGVIFSTYGLSVIVGPPIAGVLYTAAGNDYAAAFYVAASCLLVSGVVTFGIGSTEAAPATTAAAAAAAAAAADDDDDVDMVLKSVGGTNNGEEEKALGQI
jgi:MFS family permease